MSANQVSEKNELKDWADILRKLVNECLIPSSSSADSEAKNTTSDFDSFHKIFDIQKLYTNLEDEITLKYWNGNNVRNVLTDEEEAKDLFHLVCDAGDIVEKKIGAVLAVSFSGIISARLDSNYRTILEMLEWSNEALPEGFKSNQFLVLRIAECYVEFGKVRHGGTRTRMPKIDDLNDLMAKAKLEEEERKTDYSVYLHLFLVDSVAQLPPYLLSNELTEYSDWLEEVENSTKKKALARFSYYSSRVAYSQNKLDEAIIYAMDALQAAPARSGDFINQCRQHLLALEQEKAARSIIKSESVKESVKESVDKAGARLDIMLKEAHSEFNYRISEVKDEMEENVTAFRKDIRSDIKDSLLRVIEILGIFLAVASVAVTAVGGISVGDSIWQSLGIFALGYLAIVSLFFILRLMVIKPLIVVRQDSRNIKKQAENPQTIDATSVVISKGNNALF